LLHNQLHLSSGAGTIGQKWPQYKGFSSNPLAIKKIEAQSTPGPYCGWEGLAKLKKIHLIRTRTWGLPVCCIVLQPITLVGQLKNPVTSGIECSNFPCIHNKPPSYTEKPAKICTWDLRDEVQTWIYYISKNLILVYLSQYCWHGCVWLDM
jgi:hypothetical protein